MWAMRHAHAFEYPQVPATLAAAIVSTYAAAASAAASVLAAATLLGHAEVLVCVPNLRFSLAPAGRLEPAGLTQVRSELRNKCYKENPWGAPEIEANRAFWSILNWRQQKW